MRPHVASAPAGEEHCAVVKDQWQKYDRKVLKAVERDDVRRIEKYIARALPIDKELRRCQNQFPATLLAHACDNKATRTVRFLIESGANPDKGRYYPPLFGAVHNGGRAVVQLLLDAGANPNVRARFNPDPSPDRDKDSRWTPLMCATVCGKFDLVNLLLERGADPNVTTRLGLSALDFAIAHRHDRLIARLLKAGAKASGLSLFTPIERGDLPTVKRLIHAGADVNVFGNAASGAMAAGQTPLEAAVLARCRIDSEIELEVELGEIRGGCESAARQKLLERKRHHFGIIKALVRAGAQLNGPTRWRSPLLVAASGGDLEVVKFLIDAGADPNAATSAMPSARGTSALHHAALGGSIQIVKALIVAGADVNKLDQEGNSVLQALREQNASQKMTIAEVAMSHGVQKTQAELDALRKEWEERRARIIDILERNMQRSR